MTVDARSTLRIGTRGSELALYQARAVAARLAAQTGIATEIAVIRTSGDRLAEAPLSEIGGKRLFVKEIEDALLGHEVDLAVHSSKDMPVVLPDGLTIAGVLAREDPRDALVLPAGRAPLSVEQARHAFGTDARIGTSSIRRIAQLTTLWPGARFVPVRGNLNTRLRKLDGGEYDALILAAAGLRRLEFSHRLSGLLPLDACVPAPGQGIIAVEVREDDDATRRLVAAIDDGPARAALAAERAVIGRLGGGCQMPIGACAVHDGDDLTMRAIVVAPDGTRAARAAARGPASDPEALGVSIAELLLADGAGDILAAVLQTQADVKGLQP